jgi:adenylate cyclase
LPLVVVVVLLAHLVLADVAWQRGHEIDVVYPWLAAVAVAVSLVAFRYVTEVRDRRRVVATFGEYVPPAAVEQLLDRERFRAASEGERVDVTVLFADLRGFTAASADRDPRDVRTMLEHFYERAAGIVFDHGGTVMQYVGDEVFAVFGAPTSMPEHATRGVAAAVAMRDAAAAINAELAERDLPPIAYGIGLNAGPVVAGHVGNRYRRQYAVVGDTVNVGSRLCSAAGAGEVVVSGSVYDRLDGGEDAQGARPLTGLALKGVDRDVGARVLAGGGPPG